MYKTIVTLSLTVMHWNTLITTLSGRIWLHSNLVYILLTVCCFLQLKLCTMRTIIMTFFVILYQTQNLKAISYYRIIREQLCHICAVTPVMLRDDNCKASPRSYLCYDLSNNTMSISKYRFHVLE